MLMRRMTSSRRFAHPHQPIQKRSAWELVNQGRQDACSRAAAFGKTRATHSFPRRSLRRTSARATRVLRCWVNGVSMTRNGCCTGLYPEPAHARSETWRHFGALLG
eukprot:7182315-Pyramimonas_sp.AAC.2